MVAHVPSRRLFLRTARTQEARELGRKLAVLLAALVLAGALVGATWNTRGDFALVGLPLAALLGFTALFALASVVSQTLRALRGVPLELDAEGGRVRGVPQPQGLMSGYSSAAVERPLSEVREVALVLHRDAAPGGSFRALARLEVVLEGELRLQGPEAMAPEHAWGDARDRLAPLAAELARVAQRPLHLDYRFSAQSLRLSPAELVSAPSPAAPG